MFAETIERCLNWIGKPAALAENIKKVVAKPAMLAENTERWLVNLACLMKTQMWLVNLPCLQT